MSTSTIPTLPDIAPSRSTRMQARHRVSAVRFGGGHALYIREGNAPPDHEWSVVWQALAKTDTTRLAGFFEQRNGVEAFFWTPPGAASAQRFICTEWQVAPEGGDYAQVSARLIRLYP